MLAAGKGTRMKTELPKVLVPVCGRPMIDYVLDTLAARSASIGSWWWSDIASDLVRATGRPAAG